MESAGLDLAALATESGLSADRLEDALAGNRRLDVPAMQALVVALGGDWWDLRCDHGTGDPPCDACDAPNIVTEGELMTACDLVERLLAEARVGGITSDDWPRLATFEAARRALIALGGDLHIADLAINGIDALVADPTKDLALIARRAAAFSARGDSDTVELVGLDISGDIPDGLVIAGWELRKIADADMASFSPLPATAYSEWNWDRISATNTWWLHRDAGVGPALSRSVISFAEPRAEATAPLLALSLLKDEPPLAISHGYAQPGHGVSFSVNSRQLDYSIEAGYLDVQSGPYHVDSDEGATWAEQVRYLGQLADSVMARNTKPARRYASAAEQFLTVAEDLNRGWHPLPRLALEMSTVAELLLLSGASEGEVSRRVRVAAAWLGGVNDDDRGVIHDFAKRLYDAGSKYRHGGAVYELHRGPSGSPTKNLDVVRAYRLLRRLLMHGLAVVAAGESVAALCDDAQRLAAPRIRLEGLISRLYDDLGVARQRFPPG